MTRGKAIAAALAGAAVLLGAIAALELAGVGTGYSLAPAESAGGKTAGLAALEREPVKMKPWPEYGEVLARPLFNESRAPEEKPVVDEKPGGEVAALNVVLTGVVLTKDVRIAIVKDNATGKTVRVKLGQPLEGDQAGWTLAELKPRGAVFDGGGLGRQELELTVDTKGAPAPEGPTAPQPAPDATAMAQPQPAPNAAPAATENPPQAATAEDIRRRIEERRRQLREEAQRMLEQGQPEEKQQ